MFEPLKKGERKGTEEEDHAGTREIRDIIKMEVTQFIKNYKKKHGLD